MKTKDFATKGKPRAKKQHNESYEVNRCKLKRGLQQLKISSLITLLPSKICKRANVYTAGHFECELHLSSKNQRLK